MGVNWPELVRFGAAWVVKRWGETRPPAEYDRETERVSAQARLLEAQMRVLEAKVRADLAGELTEAQIRSLIEAYKQKPRGMPAFLEELKRLDEEERAALAKETDPVRIEQIKRVFSAQRRALEFRGPVA